MRGQPHAQPGGQAVIAAQYYHQAIHEPPNAARGKRMTQPGKEKSQGVPFLSHPI